MLTDRKAQHCLVEGTLYADQMALNHRTDCLLFSYFFVFCAHHLATFIINDHTKIPESLCNFLGLGRWKIQNNCIFILYIHM